MNEFEIGAPIRLRFCVLNDWTYFAGLPDWQVGWVLVETGWPPLLVVKVLGLGFRLEIDWSTS